MSKQDPREGYTVGKRYPSWAPALAWWLVIGFLGWLLWTAWNTANSSNKRGSEARQARFAALDAETRAKLAKGPTTRTWGTPQGQLVELLIPVDRHNVGMVEIQRCIVWRDAVTATSSMHCDAEARVDVE